MANKKLPGYRRKATKKAKKQARAGPGPGTTAHSNDSRTNAPQADNDSATDPEDDFPDPLKRDLRHCACADTVLQDIVYPNGMHGQLLLDQALLDALLPLAPPPRPPPAPTSGPYTHPVYRRTLPGRGEGLFPAHAHPAHARIFFEWPIFLAAAPSAQMCRALFARVPPHLRVAVQDLVDCGPAGARSHEEGVLRTNALSVSVGAHKQTVAALFPLAAKCNHSCVPSAYWTWDEKTFSLAVYAARDLQAHEELTIAYIPVQGVCRADRRRTLQRRYRFLCMCPMCLLPGERAVPADAQHPYLQAERSP
ncbi:hypothetical protein PLICRDRAFT_180058 [Plicaturopsis crispa FD-325 SS-3]|uniref:SET domain-containing protein n=1 Tax=Plicaturopsis crispa FD-325 SS-3 TaxID=944288 RepID=A0A0C9SKG7_PLICR|nr:hypothetical protein PLICRDRAFT_180058 [Plicaturopsis crispa FD-325 SS-3]